MAGIAAKSFDTPDEQRAPDKTKVEVVDLGSVKAARMAESALPAQPARRQLADSHSASDARIATRGG